MGKDPGERTRTRTRERAGKRFRKRESARTAEPQRVCVYRLHTYTKTD